MGYRLVPGQYGGMNREWVDEGEEGGQSGGIQHMTPHPTIPGLVWDANMRAFTPAPGQSSPPIWTGIGDPRQEYANTGVRPDMATLGSAASRFTQAVQAAPPPPTLAEAVRLARPVLTPYEVDQGSEPAIRTTGTLAGYENAGGALLHSPTGSAPQVQTGVLSDQPSVPMVGPGGQRSSIAANLIEPSLRAGWRPTDETGQPYDAREFNGGWVFGSNQGWVPLNVLTGGGWQPGQQDAITQGTQSNELPPLELEPAPQPGFGSFAEPFRETFTGESVYTSKPFTDEFKFDYDTALQSPAFRRRLDEGRRIIEGAAAARGGLYSGRTGKELMRFGGELASDELEKEYGRAWNQFQDKKGTFYGNEAQRESDYNKAWNEFRQRHDIFKGNQADIFNRFSVMSGLGQTTGTTLGSQGAQFGGTLGNTIMAAGQARGTGVTEAANARIFGAQSFGDTARTLALLRQFGR